MGRSRSWRARSSTSWSFDAGRRVGAPGLDQDARVEELVEVQKELEEAQRNSRIPNGTSGTVPNGPADRVGNRRALEDRLEDEFARIRRSGGSLAVAMIDLDHSRNSTTVRPP